MVTATVEKKEEENKKETPAATTTSAAGAAVVGGTFGLRTDQYAKKGVDVSPSCPCSFSLRN